MCKDLEIKQLEYYVNEKENQYFDRKSSRIKPFDILKHLVGFANSEGGQLVIGIEDDGKITGFKCENCHRIEEYINISFTELKETPILPIVTRKKVKNYKNEDDEILILTINISNDRVIKCNDNNVYLRQFDKTIKLNAEQILQLHYDRGQRYFEDEIVEDANLEDLDENLINEYKIKMNVENINTLDLLKARNLIKKGKLTNACILLFGNNPTKFLPQAKLKVIKYSGIKALFGKEINVVKEQIFDGSILDIIKKSKIFVGTLLRDFQYLDDDGTFKIKPEYPEFTWTEGIVNALVHRNYSIRGDYIKVIMYEDRLEIMSPGLLPNIVTIKNILNQRYSRNPRIARILTEFGYVKEMNEGVKRIYNEMGKLFLSDPDYSEPNYNVLLTLENNILNRHSNVPKNNFNNLTKDERKILQYMFNTGKTINTKKATDIMNKSKTHCNLVLKKMKDKKLLIWHGTSVRDKTQYYTLNF
ncbi:ATP-binding protein [Sneathia sanguinegens]|uniref:ATP-binding protein n=1 Tax=Sneathia sanguinegens TaxID=40543 RepID=UPI002590FE9C|nr:ATP-binding protein [Sneathia sanguinegens]MDU4652653.1 ATP-binding protein [Sneathia sanguinegens]